jgi:alpha-1,3-glucan synthase
MLPIVSICYLVFGILSVTALRFDSANVGYNLNENTTATEPRDYWGQWPNHTFHPSPQNWRFPFYILTTDRFADGDPTNNNANNTVFENNWMTTQFRFGGDVMGVLGSLDYLQGMGIKSIYFTGSMMLNSPWSSDGYGPLDFTLLDRHHGSIQEWRSLIDEIHRREMYVVFDNTIATMGNLLDYAGSFQNTTVNFSFHEHDYIWKYPEQQYHDFHPSNTWATSCNIPRIWESNGYNELKNVTDQFICKQSDFQMYGNINGTGAYPSYVNQFSRFASVQDKLREWDPQVLQKINVMSCLQIAMLDIDGFRIDKAVQTTVDALAEFSDYQRKCARRFGKNNFLVVGEVVADPKLGAIYYGRGKDPSQSLVNSSVAFYTSNITEPTQFIRPFGLSALAGAAFHYDVYGSMSRFLGLDGPWGKLGVDWVDIWNQMLSTQDLVNANTGVFDPRHMFGMTNQDVFRWPALVAGTQRQLLGFFVCFLELPGIPMIMFGEEQEHYVLENLAPDYVFGRTPMASSRAWQVHGCYNLGEEGYVNMPFNKSGSGCNDNSVSLDHRDPSNPVRNIIQRMLELRTQYPVLNDGFNLTTLSTRLHNIFLPGSQGMASPLGIWSVYRARSPATQDFSSMVGGNQPVWLVFHNENQTITYDFDCASTSHNSSSGALVSAFDTGTKVKNLFYPYDEYELEASQFSHGFDGSSKPNGCIRQISLRPWEFKAFVPTDKWRTPKPSITDVSPGHDARLISKVNYGDTETVQIEIGFSAEMDCKSVSESLTINSTTYGNVAAALNKSTIACSSSSAKLRTGYIGEVPTVWTFTAELNNVANGVHKFSVNNASSTDGMSTGSRDKFMFRIGQTDNPIVFPSSANYTSTMLHKTTNGSLCITLRASGAEKFRYSTNWGSSYSDWMPYVEGNYTIKTQSWSGTKKQKWKGEHIIVQFWNQMIGSSHHVQHADLAGSKMQPSRRWPHAWVHGEYNEWGYDSGLENQMNQISTGEWKAEIFAEWPSSVLVNVWGINPDGRPDKSAAFGDIDQDGVLDLVPPDSLANNVISILKAPSGPYFGYQLIVNDGNLKFYLMPRGSTIGQGIIMGLLCFVPLITAILGVRSFMAAFYKVKFNRIGASKKRNPASIFRRMQGFSLHRAFTRLRLTEPEAQPGASTLSTRDDPSKEMVAAAIAADAGSSVRRRVLLATMEYEIEDWGIQIKIGGLGVMASMMTRNLGHRDLIWVVPCVGDIEYPFSGGRLHFISLPEMTLL